MSINFSIKLSNRNFIVNKSNIYTRIIKDGYSAECRRGTKYWNLPLRGKRFHLRNESAEQRFSKQRWFQWTNRFLLTRESYKWGGKGLGFIQYKWDKDPRGQAGTFQTQEEKFWLRKTTLSPGRSLKLKHIRREQNSRGCEGNYRQTLPDISKLIRRHLTNSPWVENSLHQLLCLINRKVDVGPVFDEPGQVPQSGWVVLVRARGGWWGLLRGIK